MRQTLVAAAHSCPLPIAIRSLAVAFRKRIAQKFPSQIKGDVTKLNFDEYLAGFIVVLGIVLSAAPLVSKFITRKIDIFYAKKLFRENVNLEIAKSLELPLNLSEDYR
jgi:hypothetical protein